MQKTIEATRPEIPERDPAYVPQQIGEESLSGETKNLKAVAQNLGERALVGSSDYNSLKPDLSEDNQPTSEENEPKVIYADKFRRWIELQDAVKDTEERGLGYNSRVKYIEEKNNIQSEFMTYLAGIDSTKKQDRAVEDIFRSLGHEEQNAFIKEGFINGVVKEMLVYKYLLIYRDKLAENGIDSDAQLSTTDQDLHDGFDMSLTLPGGRIILFDAKSSIPIDASTKFRDPEHVGEKSKETRDGKPVYVLCPNPKNKRAPQYIQNRKLRSDLPAVPSFEMPNNIAGFVQVIHRTVNTILEREKAHKKAIQAFVR